MGAAIGPALFARIADEAGLPPGVLNVHSGLWSRGRGALGEASRRSCGEVLDGSTAVGRRLAVIAGERSPGQGCHWNWAEKIPWWYVMTPILKMRSNGQCCPPVSKRGQRCAAASRIIIFDTVYEEFRRKLLEPCRDA